MMNGFLAFVAAFIAGFAAFIIVRIVPTFLGQISGGTIVSEAVIGFLQGGSAAIVAALVADKVLQTNSHQPKNFILFVLFILVCFLSFQMLSSDFEYLDSRALVISSAIAVPFGFATGWFLSRG
jgi:hypothetical protein